MAGGQAEGELTQELAAAKAHVVALEAALAGDEAEVAKAAAEHAAREANARQRREEVAAAKQQLALLQARLDPAWRDWARDVPAEVLAMVAEALVAQTEAGWVAWLKETYPSLSEERIHKRMARRKRDGNCLFVFARVCKHWRKAQLKVGGPLCTRVRSDVILPGSVALVKWALAEGCPRVGSVWYTATTPHTMAHTAAGYGQVELVEWLCGEGGFAMDVWVMNSAARGGNLELVRWLRGEGCDWSDETCQYAAEAGRLGILEWLRANGCPWDATTCHFAVDCGHVEVLRWARENGCPWWASTRDEAAAKLGYTDDLGNLNEGSDHEDGSENDEFSEDDFPDDEWMMMM